MISLNENTIFSKSVLNYNLNPTLIRTRIKRGGVVAQGPRGTSILAQPEVPIVVVEAVVVVVAAKNVPFIDNKTSDVTPVWSGLLDSRCSFGHQKPVIGSMSQVLLLLLFIWLTMASFSFILHYEKALMVSLGFKEGRRRIHWTISYITTYIICLRKYAGATRWEINIKPIVNTTLSGTLSSCALPNDQVLATNIIDSFRPFQQGKLWSIFCFPRKTKVYYNKCDLCQNVKVRIILF